MPTGTADWNIATVPSVGHGDLTDVTSDQHHAQSHAHSSHSGIGTDDHHAQAHSLASHSSEAHSELTGVGTDDHHAQAHGSGQHDDHVVINKNSDELVDNSSTLQNDDDFSFSIGANEIWVGHMVLYLDDEAAGSTNSIRCGWSLPSGASFRASGIYYRGSTEAILDIDEGTSNPFFVNFTFVDIDDSDFLVIEFTLKNGGTAGTAQFQWAQGIARTNGTIVEADSYMVAHKE